MQRTHTVKQAAPLIALATLALFTGCKQPANRPGLHVDASSDSPLATVPTVNPERRTLHHTISQPGAIQALDQPALYAKIPGYVLDWKVDLGDRIRKGDVLAELWVPEMEVDLALKDSQVRQAEAQLQLARQAVLAAEADYNRARTQYERVLKVSKGGVLDKDAVDETRYNSEACKARLEMARADIGVKEAQHAVAQKSRLHAQTMLQYAQIVAPFDGIVTKRNVDKGQFVQPATGTRGDILFTIARTDIMRIFVEVPELEAGWVTSGMPASVRVQALRGEELAGRVTRTSWSLDRTTRTLLAAIDLPNPDGKLRPGMYAYATITGEQADVLTLPASAIVTQGDVTQGYRSFCYIVQDGNPRRTLVELGARDEKWVEVLKKQAATPASAGQPRWESFRGDEAVIAGDVSGLSDGQTVQPAVPAK